MTAFMTMRELNALDPIKDRAQFLPFLPPPTTDDPRPLAAILFDLSHPVHPDFLDSKVKKGTEIVFIGWDLADEILDFYAHGWEWHPVVTLSADGAYATCHGQLIIPTSDRGPVSRGATAGMEDDEKQYGEPTHHAESGAFRRACARFRLMLAYYHSKDLPPGRPRFLPTKRP